MKNPLQLIVCHSSKSLRWLVFSFFGTMLALFPCYGTMYGHQNTGSDPAYLNALMNWRMEHEKKFRSPSGWLALIGHYWLREGDNPIGSTIDSFIRLPDNQSDPFSGVIRLTNNSLELRASAGCSFIINGQKVTSSFLSFEKASGESDGPDKIQIGERITLQVVRRVGKLAIRVRDSQSELLTGFTGKSWYAPNADYCVIAKFVPTAQPTSAEIENVKGDRTEVQVAGTLTFDLLGGHYELMAISETPSSLFVIFKDHTNGDATYQGGRFLDVELPTDGQDVVLDFNKAYQPPCAFSDHTLCPTPPPQNRLNLRIEAGERKSDSPSPARTK